ncbi:MAG TPA: phospholipase D family protein [Tetrasphaera sp.]|uniref:phospholipase D family protein n=1 Tax=Nostocoides sp. TaxID=1917966 RepID=UPI002CE2E92E|nr:phospholipase D family protein [Tetrasphaera sp.]HNQ05622.1 phospholipase D family protein [Tetrasphaera sp.]
MLHDVAMAVADWFLTLQERENPHSRLAAPSAAPGWTTGNHVQALVHGRPYFEDLHQRIAQMDAGDRIYFTDWRGDPDEQLTDDGQTLSASLVAAAERGVDVRGLLWRSHWRYLGFHAEKHRQLGEDIDQAGGQCLRDMRVRTLGAHHQKFVILRHRDDSTRDVAYVGGIDICHSRRDDARHTGDPQALQIAAAFGPTPAWHDVQAALRGPVVHDVETTFRERWEDSTPLTLNPGRTLSSFLQGEDQEPRPLGEQWPPPGPVSGGTAAVQVVRTYPAILPKGYDFAPDGERSIALANSKAVARARRLIYVEDQYLWSTEVGKHFADALTANPDLRMLIVLPMIPDVDAPVAKTTQFYGRRLAMEQILATGGDRVAVFGLCNAAGLPIYVHSKLCVIDDQWASVGSDNLNRRSWTSDSEIACLVVDERDSDSAAPDDSFPVLLLRELAAEHLGCIPEEIPTDLHDLFDAFVASADALDSWYAAATDPTASARRDPRHLARHLARPRRKHGHRMDHARNTAAQTAKAAVASSVDRGPRPPGQLRRFDLPHLSQWQMRWAPKVYSVFDPDGTVLRDESLRELSRPGVGAQE